MRAKCIRNYNDVNHFNVGQIYEVKQSSNPDLFDVCENGNWSYYWCKTRFELLDDTFIESEPTKKFSKTSLAQHLVSKLFELGNEGDKLTNRISFMVGTYGVDEECSGGMNKVALEKFFERVIASYKGSV
jgi:hypothetical protein